MESIKGTEDELELFERETLAINREMLKISQFTYRVAIFAFLAAAAAAIFVGAQVKIMSYQTQILASQTESAAAGASIDEMNTRKQLEIGQKQAEALQGQLMATRNNFLNEQQPFLWITSEPVDFGWDDKSNRGFWTMHFTNYGKSAAWYTIDRAMEIGPDALEKALKHRIVIPSRQNVTSRLPQGKVDFFSAYSDVKKSEFIDAFNHDGWIVLVGTFIYYDQVGKVYTTDFCDVRYANGSISECAYQHKAKKSN